MKKGNNTISSIFKGSKAIDKIMKGTLVVYEAFKKLIASGVPPITLQKCKGVDDGKYLLDYKIYGNSVQDGEPTPDNPIEIQSVGDKTKNYLDIEHLGNINNWDTEPTYASYEITLPNGNYVFNFETDLESYSGHILILNKRKSASGGAIATFINGSYNIQNKQGKFTISNNEKIYLNWYCGSKNQSNLTKLINDVLNNFIIEEGNSFTGYEPYGYKIPVKVSGENIEPVTTNVYLNEPLRKIGDYADYIDFETHKVIRKVGYHKFNSDVKDFHYNSNLNSTMYGNAITNKKIGHTEIKSNRFIPSTDSTKLYTIGYILGRSSSNIVSFVISGDLATTPTEVQNWLENNSVNLCYPLETPTEETIGLPNIPLNKGTNIIEVDTNLLPSNMEVKYYGKE